MPEDEHIEDEGGVAPLFQRRALLAFTPAVGALVSSAPAFAVSLPIQKQQSKFKRRIPEARCDSKFTNKGWNERLKCQ